MRRLLLTLGLVASILVTPIVRDWPVARLHAAAAYVQECNSTGGAVATLDCSAWSTGNVTANNHIIVFAGNRSSPLVSLTSVTKQAGTATIGTAVEIDDALATGGSFQSAGSYCLPVTGTGTLTLRVTFSGTASAAVTMNAAEYSGLDTGGCDSTTIDGHNIRADNGGACNDTTSSGNITTGNNNSIVVGMILQWSDTAIAGSGFTLRSSQASNPTSYIEDKVLATAGVTDAKFGIVSEDANCVVAVLGLKEAGGGGATPVLRGTLLGVLP